MPHRMDRRRVLKVGAVAVAAAVMPQPMRIGRFTLALSSVGMMLAQILIASADVALAGSVLYVLLPGVKQAFNVE